MAYEFRLPDIGEGVVEGEVVRWLVKEGERIKEDQPMVEVMTDKATVEIPSPRGGVVQKIFVAAGAVCKVGQAMVAIEEAARPGSKAPRAAVPPASVPAGSAAPAKSVGGPAAGPPGPTPALLSASATADASAHPERRASDLAAGRALAAPAVRRRARELGVDIGQVAGSGPAGRVMAEDVERHATGNGHGSDKVLPLSGAHPGAHRRVAAGAHLQQEGELEDERIPLRGLRKTIAEKMALSKRTAAHFTYVEECDVTELMRLREQAQAILAAKHGPLKLTYMPFILKAVLASLREFPMCNAWLDEAKAEIVYRRQYHIGIAAATPAGLTVPVVRNADERSLLGLAKEVDRLGQAARTGKATREELTGSTFTITSLGALGGVMATPIINYPEVAILGVHAFREQPRVVAGQIAIRTVGNLSVSFDHRVVDGMEGAMFLQAVCKRLSSPGLLLLDEAAEG